MQFASYDSRKCADYLRGIWKQKASKEQGTMRPTETAIEREREKERKKETETERDRKRRREGEGDGEGSGESETYRERERERDRLKEVEKARYRALVVRFSLKAIVTALHV